MTYLDLIRNADYKLDNDAITLGEYEQMIEPLNREIQPEHKIMNENNVNIPIDSIHIDFQQTFPNTAGIFENGGMSGQAFITQNIDIYIDTDNNLVYVFGNDKLAYIIKNPNYEMIFNDIRRRNIYTTKKSMYYSKE